MRKSKDEGPADAPRPEPFRLKERRPVRKRFATEHGFTEAEVDRIVKLGRKCGRENTHVVNGDTHPRIGATTDDKNVHAGEWGKDLDETAKQLLAIVAPKGFTLRFDGLFPHLHRTGTSEGASVMIPYE